MADALESKQDPAQIVIPFSDDDREDVDDDQIITDDKGVQTLDTKARQDKRNERNRAQRAENKAKIDRLEAEKNELATRLARVEGVVSSQVQQQTQGPDKFEQELDHWDRKKSETYERYQAHVVNKTLTAELQKEFETTATQIERAKGRVYARQELASQKPVQRQESEQQYWQHQYPEVYRDPRAVQWAEGKYKQLAAEGVNKSSFDLTHEVMQQAKTNFKLGTKAAPSEADKHRLSGRPSSGGGGSSPSGIVMTSVFKDLAEAAHPGLKPEEAHKKWAQTTGKKLREKGIA